MKKAPGKKAPGIYRGVRYGMQDDGAHKYSSDRGAERGTYKEALRLLKGATFIKGLQSNVCTGASQTRDVSKFSF